MSWHTCVRCSGIHMMSMSNNTWSVRIHWRKYDSKKKASPFFFCFFFLKLSSVFLLRPSDCGSRFTSFSIPFCVFPPTFTSTTGWIRSPLDKAVSSYAWSVTRGDSSLGQEDSGHEQHRHGEKKAVTWGAAAADAFLQFGNFGVEFIWRKRKSTVREREKWEKRNKCERARERERESMCARQKETNHYYIINSSI